MLEEATRLLNKSYPPASLPGQPPRKRTGKLQQSGKIIKTANGAVVRWYAPYSGYLQHGTQRMAARPFFTIALKNVLRKRRKR